MVSLKGFPDPHLKTRSLFFLKVDFITEVRVQIIQKAEGHSFSSCYVCRLMLLKKLTKFNFI